MVCMATDGAMAVQGGNWRIFDAMLKDAGAVVMLNTSVTAIEERDGQDGGRFVLRSSTRRSSTARQEEEEEQEEQEQGEHDESHFDTVILAAPYQFSNIDFSPPLTHTPSKIPYVSLHVTLFSTPHTLSASFFNLSTSKPVPDIILTTLSPTDKPSSDKTNQVGTPGFFSISLLRTVINPSTNRQENVYKIFSPHKPSSSFMAKLLGLDIDLPQSNNDKIEGGEKGEEEEEEEDKGEEEEEEEGEGEGEEEQDITENSSITWRHDRRWDSYPYLYPRITFEEIRLSGTDQKGVWYTSGMESFISTMETMSLMGMNVARLVVDAWLGTAGSEGEESELKV